MKQPWDPPVLKHYGQRDPRQSGPRPPTKADQEVIALLPEDWFSPWSLPHFIKNREYRCQRLVAAGILERRPGERGAEFRRKAPKEPPMTTFKCRKCGNIWSEGPTRDIRMDERCRHCMKEAKDEAYLERNRLVAVLTKIFPSGLRGTDIPRWDPEWHGCVYVDLPTGQASWHFHTSHADLFAHLGTYLQGWDGHTTEEKYKRLAALPMVGPGSTVILGERIRQITVEGWTPEHDAEHTDGSLAMAAVAYAAPERIYRQAAFAAGLTFVDPFPRAWEVKWDKCLDYGERRTNPGNVPPDPATYTKAERLDLLKKAGALIAAEYDRLVAAP